PAPPFGRIEDLPPRLEPVLLRKEALHHVAELPLLGSGTEPHGELLQPENALGDDVLLDLVGTAVDRRLAKIQVRSGEPVRIRRCREWRDAFVAGRAPAHGQGAGTGR